MEKFIVYKITNTINNKVYVGITKCSLKKRWTEHRFRSKSSDLHLYKSIRKHGVDNFKIEVLKECETAEEMYQMEIDTIKALKSNDRLFGYNNSTGGEVSSKGKKHTDETKKRISEVQKGMKRPPLSEETKAKISAKSKGRNMSKLIKASADSRRGKPAKNRVKVILNDELIFDSISEASISTGISIASICQNINNNSKYTSVGVWKRYLTPKE